MESPLKIYVLEVGAYSDHHVVGVFSAEENAQRYAEAHGLKDDAHMTAYVLDAGMTEVEQGLSFFDVALCLDNGETYRACKTERAWHPEEYYPASRSAIGRDLYHTYCWARDKTHAIKIASERMATWQIRTRWTPAHQQAHILSETQRRQAEHHRKTSHCCLKENESWPPGWNDPSTTSRVIGRS
jgi:hypothetical protein